MNAQQTMCLRSIGPSSAVRPAGGLAMENVQPPNIGASLRQKLLPGGSTSAAGVAMIPSGNAGAVLEHLKRHADRMIEEQESTRHDVNTYRERLAELQATLSRTEQDLARERQENVMLRAKAKDDAAQVSYVNEKMKVVAALQESVRASIDNTKHDIGRVDQYRRDLDVKMLGQDRDIGDVQMALRAATTARDQLAGQLRHAQDLAADLQSQLRSAAEEVAHKDAAVERQAADAAARERAAEMHASSLQASLSTARADLAASRSHGEQLQHDLDTERSRSAKEAAQLVERYQEAQQRIKLLDAQLSAAHTEQKASREQIFTLEEQMQGLLKAASSMREELANAQAMLADRTSELKNSTAEAEQLGRRLEALQAEMACREADVQRLAQEGAETATRLEELTTLEAALREELSARSAEVVRLVEELTAEREGAKAKGDELATMLAAAQAAAAAEAARAAASVAAAEQRIREAERAGEARLERFAERTARENDEMRRRVRSEAEAEAKRLSEELKKVTAALQAAESAGARSAAEREAAVKAELQALRKASSEEIATLKAQVAQAGQKADAQAQESKAKYERDVSAARAEAQEALAALRLRMEVEHQKERDEWDKEMEAVTAAERKDAEEHAQRLVDNLRAELEANAEQSLRDAAAASQRQREELEERVKTLSTRLQELESGSAAGDQALTFARENASRLELQLSAARQEVAAAREKADADFKRLHDQSEQQRMSFEQQKSEWQAQQRSLEQELVQLKERAVDEEQLRGQVQKLNSDALEAQRQWNLEREDRQRQDREREEAQAQMERERLRLQEELQDLQRQLESKTAPGKQQQQQLLSDAEALQRETVVDEQVEVVVEELPENAEHMGHERGAGDGSGAAADGRMDRSMANDHDIAAVVGDPGACDAAPGRSFPLERIDQGARPDLEVETPAVECPKEDTGLRNTATFPRHQSQSQPGQTADKEKNIGDKKGTHKAAPTKPPPKKSQDSGRGQKPLDTVMRDSEAKDDSNPVTAAAGTRKSHATAAKGVVSGNGGVTKPSNTAARSKPAADVSKPTGPHPKAAPIKGGDGENTKKDDAGKGAAAGSRQPLVPQGNMVNARSKAYSSMPPPPAKAPKAAAVSERLPATTTTATGATGTQAARKVASVRRSHDEFADLTTESEMDDPTQSQDVTVTGHPNKRVKTGREDARAAPSQMPAATKGGRFSLFKGMSMGMSVQTTTADVGGGNEVSSAFGGGATGGRKKASGIPSSKQQKGGASDGKCVMDLFAGMSPYPKK